jgi:hypothetical protein
MLNYGVITKTDEAIPDENSLSYDDTVFKEEEVHDALAGLMRINSSNRSKITLLQGLLQLGAAKAGDLVNQSAAMADVNLYLADMQADPLKIKSHLECALNWQPHDTKHEQHVKLFTLCHLAMLHLNFPAQVSVSELLSVFISSTTKLAPPTQDVNAKQQSPGAQGVVDKLSNTNDLTSLDVLVRFVASFAVASNDNAAMRRALRDSRLPSLSGTSTGFQLTDFVRLKFLEKDVVAILKSSDHDQAKLCRLEGLHSKLKLACDFARSPCLFVEVTLLLAEYRRRNRFAKPDSVSSASATLGEAFEILHSLEGKHMGDEAYHLQAFSKLLSVNPDAGVRFFSQEPPSEHCTTEAFVARLYQVAFATKHGLCDELYFESQFNPLMTQEDVKLLYEYLGLVDYSPQGFRPGLVLRQLRFSGLLHYFSTFVSGISETFDALIQLRIPAGPLMPDIAKSLECYPGSFSTTFADDDADVCLESIFSPSDPANPSLTYILTVVH